MQEFLFSSILSASLDLIGLAFLPGLNWPLEAVESDAQALCGFIEGLKHSLRFLDLHCFNSSQFTRLLNTLQRNCENVTWLSLSYFSMPKEHIVALCRVLDSMARVTTLHLGIEDDAGMLVFAEYVLRSNRRFVSLRLGIPQDLSAKTLSVLNAALKSAHVHQLIVDGFFQAHDLLFDVASAGWLTSISGVKQSVTLWQHLRANIMRHSRCQTLCLRIICVRRFKRALNAVPLPIVVYITKCIWETRNEKEWSEQ